MQVGFVSESTAGQGHAQVVVGGGEVGLNRQGHNYGTGGYPAQLVLQDALTLHGSQFKDAALIVASPPCQEFSYMAMPWSRGKQIRRALLGEDEFPSGYKGSRTKAELTALFDACFRIQREAIEAAGHFIPLVVENVKGAQDWVGRSRWNYGSFHLYGDVPALMPMTKAVKLGGGASWYPPDDPRHVPGIDFTRLAGQKTPEGNCSETMWKDRPIARLAHATPAEMEAHGFKVPGFRFDGSGKSFQTASVEGQKSAQDGLGGYGGSFGWNNTPMRRGNSRSSGRKAASAAIAKIPRPLAQYIARVYYPKDAEC